MNNKLLVVVVAAIVAVGVAAGAVFLLNNHEDPKPISGMDKAELKVLGNANGDRYIDNKDVEMIEKCISNKVSLEDAPLADADNNGVIDEADVEIVKKIINGESTHIWHINYHDVDGDGVMDSELVETAFPVKSAIMSGSANAGILYYQLGIVNEIKGVARSSSSLDSYLYASTYLDTTKCTLLNDSSASSIAIENGKIGASNKIASDSVTCLLTDWNRTYITNEDKFEAAHVDVVRIAAASFEPSEYTHSIMLLGLLFQKNEQANATIAIYDEVYDSIKSGVSGIEKKSKAVASSMNGYISSEDSDYTQMVVSAGAEYGLSGFNFGGSSAILAADNLGMFDTTKYNFDYIVHIRTTLGYNTSESTYTSEWSTYTQAFTRWENSSDGQYLVSGVIPVPARIAYSAYAMYGDSVPALSLEWANNIHAKFINLYPGTYSNLSATGHQFVIKDNPAKTIICQAIEGDNVFYDSVSKKFFGEYAAGVKHNMRVVTSDPTAVVKYGTVEGTYDLNACPDYVEKGVYTVYYKATASGKTDATGKFSITVGDRMSYTATGYTGTVDGSNHSISVSVSDPVSGYTITYGTSASKSMGKDSTATPAAKKTAGTTTTYFTIVADGYIDVHGSEKVVLTAASA